uniref:Uncharacterized protein n=1 Tax=Hyaloperonospora arabidopsidis (strain Emoy2) TaxID=559515 RepID=M4BRI0_HYAAE
MPRSARLIREVGLRRFLHCYAVTGILSNMMYIYMVVDTPRRSSDGLLVNKRRAYRHFVDAS